MGNDEPRTLDENEAPAESRADPEPFDDVPDGAGCTEIWEHLSERREESSPE